MIDVEGIVELATTTVTLASAVTALTPTPPRPAADTPWQAKIWWLTYQVIEWAAVVTRRVKERPNAAAAIIAAAEAKDVEAVVAAAKGLIRDQK